MTAQDIKVIIDNIPYLSVEDGETDNAIIISKIDDRPIGNELIDEYIYRLLGRDVMRHLQWVSSNEVDSTATYQIRAE